MTNGIPILKIIRTTGKEKQEPKYLKIIKPNRLGMNFIYLENAEKSLIGLADFIESINISGSGFDFMERFISKIETQIKPSVSYKLCNHFPFAIRGFSCIFINGWAIVFRIESDTIFIHEIVIGKLLY